MGEVARYITTADWANISGLLFPLWGLVFAVFSFAGSMLLAHAVLPSLAATRDLPDPRLLMLRPPLYISAVAFLALAVLMMLVLIARVVNLSEIFPFHLV